MQDSNDIAWGVAFLALGYVVMRGTAVPGPTGKTGAAGPAGTTGPTGATGPSYRYAAHDWIDPLNGSDAPGAGRGNFSQPWLTYEAWSDSYGPPTTLAEYETVLHLHVMTSDPLNGELKFAAPQSRRICIHAVGQHVPAIEWNLDVAETFGSGHPPDLSILGGYECTPAGLIGFSPPTGQNANASVGNTSNNAITITNIGAGSVSHLLSLSNITPQGRIRPFGFNPDDTLYAFLGCDFRDCTIELGGGGEAGILVECSRCAFPNPSKIYHFWSVQHMGDCQVEAEFEVVSAPDPSGVRGILGCRWSGSSTFSGPALSMLVDYTTNYWLIANGVVISGGAKVLIEDQTP